MSPSVVLPALRASVAPRGARRPALLALVIVALVAGLVTVAPSAGAERVRVQDRDPYESYFLGARSAEFTHGARQLSVQVKHHQLQWSTIDVVKLEMLLGRTRPCCPPSYAVGYTAEWRPRVGTRLYRQSPGQESRTRVACRGARLSHSERLKTVKVVVPQPCLRIPRASRPFLVKDPRQVRAAYLIRNEGGDVTETVPGTQSSGAYAASYTRWIKPA